MSEWKANPTVIPYPISVQQHMSAWQKTIRVFHTNYMSNKQIDALFILGLLPLAYRINPLTSKDL
jgi:hypothetical protein